MKLSDYCGLDPTYWEVEIWSPPGGYAKVAEDGSFTVDVEEGHKLSASSPCPGAVGAVAEQCWQLTLTGNPTPQNWGTIGWEPAKDNGELSINCE